MESQRAGLGASVSPSRDRNLSASSVDDAAARASDEYQQLWQHIRQTLKEELGEATYRSWLSPLNLHGVDSGVVTLSVPTRFMREWVQSHYQEQISQCWRQSLEGFQQCHIIVDRSALNAATSGKASGGTEAEEAAPTIIAHEEEDLHAFSSPLDPRYTFEHFVSGKSNELAFAAAKRVAEGNQVLTGCNPLFIHSGVGLGKTHLMHSIAWHIRQHSPERRVLYLSAEKFMYQFIRALRNKEAFAFKELFRSVDVLMIDDIQFMSGKETTQEEFFHTFNSLIDQNKQLVISGDRSPAEMEGIEERIRSRLGWGLVADIQPTTYELRLGILQSKLEQMPGVQVPNKVVEFLAHKITSNIRELEGALNRVVAHSTLVGRAITLETTKEVLSDLLRANDKRITIEEIQKQVTQHFNIKMSDMHSARRSRVVARPRQIAMFLAKKLTTRSLPEIGRKFGGRDHTTVMHAVKRIEMLCEADPAIDDDVEALIRLIRS